MRLTPLGTSACVPNPGNACSGHLLQTVDASILLDCGPGVVGNLRTHVPDFREVSAILITHMHEDHFLDLFSLRCGLKYLPPIAGGELVRVPLYLPPGGKALLVQLQQTLLDHKAMHPVDAGPKGACGSWNDVFELHEYATGEPFAVGDVSVVFDEVVHDIPAWAVAINDGSTRFAYSGDSGPCKALSHVAKEADLFLCEVGSPNDPELEHDLAGTRAHLSGAEAGAVAKDASAKRLLLTHLWWEYDAQSRIKEAERIFTGDVALAVPNNTYWF